MVGEIVRRHADGGTCAHTRRTTRPFPRLSPSPSRRAKGALRGQHLEMQLSRSVSPASCATSEKGCENDVMHRTTYGAIGIDVPFAARPRVTEFWSAALGATTQAVDGQPEYTDLDARFGGRGIFIQGIGEGQARLHLDLHTDDRAAEVRRLVKLGATVVGSHSSWDVLSDPAGILFCVCAVDPDDSILTDAVVYEDGSDSTSPSL